MLNGFISYAHEDQEMCVELLKQFKPFERAGIIRFWADHTIAPGEHWRKEILTALESAHAALFLVSANMCWSDFIWREELPRACARSATGQLLIVPVILQPCMWDIDPSVCLTQLQAVPRGGLPIVKHNPMVDGYFDAANRIMSRVQEKFRTSQGSSHA